MGIPRFTFFTLVAVLVFAVLLGTTVHIRAGEHDATAVFGVA